MALSVEMLVGWREAKEGQGRRLDGGRENEGGNEREEESEDAGDHTILIIVLVLTSVYLPHSMMFVICSIVIWCICKASGRLRSADTPSIDPSSPSQAKLKTMKFDSDLSAFGVTTCVICLAE